MMKNLIVLTVGLLLAFASCEKKVNEPIKTLDELLMSKWSYTNHQNGLYTYERVEEFKQDRHGFAFEKAPKLINWTSGWCGTPPLHFFEEIGTYQLNETILELTSWYGIKYKILQCNENHLVLQEIE